jgi:glutaminase
MQTCFYDESGRVYSIKQGFKKESGIGGGIVT